MEVPVKNVYYKSVKIAKWKEILTHNPIDGRIVRIENYLNKCTLWGLGVKKAQYLEEKMKNVLLKIILNSFTNIDGDFYKLFL